MRVKHKIMHFNYQKYRNQTSQSKVREMSQ